MSPQRPAEFDDYERCLRELLPAGLAQASLHPASDVGELHAEEEVFIAGLGDRRRRDFSLGRRCARAALHELGLPGVPIPVGTGGAPDWPTGIVGSISHCDSLCAAVAASGSDYLGLGVDAERIEDVEPDVLPVITTEWEREWLARHPQVPAAVFFSAKEAVFKAWHPRTQHFLEFLEVELTLTKHNGFRVRSDSADLSEMCGRYAICKDLVIALAWWPVAR